MEDKGSLIGDIAKRLNISQRTVRYYEELGLIAAERSTGGYRVFNDTQVERLKIIISLKDIGMPLDEIKQLLQLRQHGATGCEAAPKILDCLHAKVDSMKATIKKYNSTIKELEDVIDLVENCKVCKNKAEEATCEKCVDDRTHHHVPPLMKTLL